MDSEGEKSGHTANENLPYGWIHDENPYHTPPIETQDGQGLGEHGLNDVQDGQDEAQDGQDEMHDGPDEVLDGNANAQEGRVRGGGSDPRVGIGGLGLRFHGLGTSQARRESSPR